MAFEPDYAFYGGEYGGKVPEKAFDEHLPHAVARVNLMIGYNAVTASNEAAYKRAICAVVDAYANYGVAASGSFSLGDFSMSGSSESGKDIATEEAEAELIGSGLLFAGVGR